MKKLPTPLKIFSIIAISIILLCLIAIIVLKISMRNDKPKELEPVTESSFSQTNTDAEGIDYQSPTDTVTTEEIETIRTKDDDGKERVYYTGTRFFNSWGGLQAYGEEEIEQNIYPVIAPPCDEYTDVIFNFDYENKDDYYTKVRDIHYSGTLIPKQEYEYKSEINGIIAMFTEKELKITPTGNNRIVKFDMFDYNEDMSIYVVNVYEMTEVEMEGKDLPKGIYTISNVYRVIHEPEGTKLAAVSMQNVFNCGVNDVKMYYEEDNPIEINTEINDTYVERWNIKNYQDYSEYPIDETAGEAESRGKEE